jgi:hypothetical protein
MTENNITETQIGKRYEQQKVIAKTCTVSRSGEKLNFILVETQFDEWIVRFTYRDFNAEFSAEVHQGDIDTLPAKQYQAMRRKAIREMKRVEPALGTTLAQWINE